MTSHSRTRVILPACVAAMSLIATGCAPSREPDLGIKVRAVSVDLAYSDEELAEEADIVEVIETIPAPAGIAGNPDLTMGDLPPVPPPPISRQPRPLPSAAPSEDCPIAPADVVPETPASVVIRHPSPPGTYARINEGRIIVELGNLKFGFPYPRTTADTVGPAEAVEQGFGPGVGDVVPGGEGIPYVGEVLPGTTTAMEWEVDSRINVENAVITRYRLTADALQLIRRTTISQAEEMVFSPSPPIDLYRNGSAHGATWSSAGVDSTTGAAYQMDATVEEKELVDVCGTLVEAWPIVVNEQFVSPMDGTVSGTNEPSIFHIAPQLDGLLVRTDQNFTETRTDSSGTPFSVTYDNVSTLASTRPEEPAS